MIKFKDLSKYYYNLGSISLGLNKINTEFKIGEFVAIVGESGSGKSTLLNVLSGLDTYEEGELFINGTETSHYNTEELEEYRRKYISFIFQSFNLVNSYTVYQNVELALLLNGESKKDVKKKILDIIDKVGLKKQRNKKVSKLSGGQKQRVAIARALAKDTPIIVADEPTGNLDEKSGNEIIKILSDISKDKLVIIVSHSYEQIEKYVTRKIKMYDGSIIEDEKLKENKSEKKNNIIKVNDRKEIGFINKLRLSFRNSFNVFTKTSLILLVFITLLLGFTLIYGSYKKIVNTENDGFGYNSNFKNVDEKRLVITNDKKELTINDINKIKKIKKVDYVLEDGFLLDLNLMEKQDNLGYNRYHINYINEINEKDLEFGRMPKNKNEIVIKISDFSFVSKTDYLNKEIFLSFGFYENENNSFKYKIVGILKGNGFENKAYFSKENLKEMRMKGIKNFSETVLNSMDKETFFNNLKIFPTNKLKSGEIIINEDYKALICKKENCKDEKILLSKINSYENKEYQLEIKNVINEKNQIDLYGNTLFNEYLRMPILISNEDFEKIYNENNYQISVFLKDAVGYKETIKEIENLGFKVYYPKKLLVNENYSSVITNVISIIMTIIPIFAIYFITYGIIKVILKSRIVYYGTLRSLGSKKKLINTLITMELVILATTAFLLVFVFEKLIVSEILNIKFLKNALEYITLNNYFIIYFALVVLTVLISIKFCYEMFKKSTISVLGEGR